MRPLADRLKESVHRILASVKVWTAITGATAAILAKRGVVLPPEAYDAIKDITMTLLGAQGIQDAAKAVAAAAVLKAAVVPATVDVVVTEAAK